MAAINLSSIPARFDDLEHRIGQIEETLKLILDHLKLKVPDERNNTRQINPIQRQSTVIKSGQYTYRPLNSSENEIRILVLLNSSSDEDSIQCSLLHISLDDALRNTTGRPAAAREKTRLLRSFSALSYTWGSIDRTSSIFIEGHEFKVTKNLEAALRHLRMIRRPTSQPNVESKNYWWVDAICINQDDVLERNHQVTLMTRIFKNGMGCHIWLGEEADNSAMAMDLVKKISTEPLRGPGEPEVKYPALSIEQKVLHWKALAALFKRPWWDRVWVRQEVAVGKFSPVHCGKATCLLHELSAAAKVLNILRDQLGREMLQHAAIEDESEDTKTMSWKSPFFLPACALADMKERRGVANKFLDLKDLIFHTRTCKATDNRDKVFAVLGLVDPEVYGLKPDYRLSLKESFCTAARSIVVKTKRLDILSGGQNPDRLYGLPSWVPNLLDDWKAQPFKIRSDVRISYGDAEFVFEEKTNILHLKGIRLGFVETLSKDTIHQDDSKERLNTLYKSWQELAMNALTNSKLRDFDRCYIDEQLLGKYKDRAWVAFLSTGQDLGYDMKYSEGGELLPPQNKSFDNIRNIRSAKSLLLLDDLSANVSVYKSVHAQLRTNGAGRRLCLSETGTVGLAPADARKGDLIVAFHGASLPYVLRKCEDNYVIVGEAYMPTYATGAYINMTDEVGEFFSIV